MTTFTIIELTGRKRGSWVPHIVKVDGALLTRGFVKYPKAMDIVFNYPVRDDDTVVEEYQSTGTSVTEDGKKWRDNYLKFIE